MKAKEFSREDFCVYSCLSWFIIQILITYQLDAEFFHQFLHARADEGVEFMLKSAERRMRVKLGIAGRQFGQQFQNIIFVHARVLQAGRR